MEHSRLSTRHAQCDICAYHESGHILFAYLCGYSCMESQLIDESNEEGFSSFSIIDYGNDLPYASRFIALEDRKFFLQLSGEERQQAINAGQKIARIYMGGSTAATVFQNKGSVVLPVPFRMDYTDLERVEFIQSVLRSIDGEWDAGYLEHSMQDALYTLGNINVWDTVQDLANRLLQFSPLTKGDIEECLEAHGIQYAAESNMTEPLQLHR